MAQLPTVNEIMPDYGAAASSTLDTISSNSTTIYISVVVFVVLFVLYKLSTHRISVDKYYLVQGGIIHKSGRYRLVYDKNNKRESMAAMFGGEKLPPYDSQHYQKATGLPFIGPMRNLSLVFINKYSPVVCDKDGVCHHIDVKRWQFDKQKSDYVKKRNKGNLAYFLAIYVPLILVVCAIGFWAYMVYLQRGTVLGFESQLSEYMRQYFGSG